MAQLNKPMSTGGDYQEKIRPSKDRVQNSDPVKLHRKQSPNIPKSHSYTKENFLTKKS